MKNKKEKDPGSERKEQKDKRSERRSDIKNEKKQKILGKMTKNKLPVFRHQVK